MPGDHKVVGLAMRMRVDPGRLHGPQSVLEGDPPSGCWRACGDRRFLAVGGKAEASFTSAPNNTLAIENCAGRLSQAPAPTALLGQRLVRFQL